MLVTGAAGFIGRRVCAALEHAGHTVRRAVRAPGRAADAIAVDLHSPDGAAHLLDAAGSVDAIVHTAWGVPPTTYRTRRGNLEDLGATARLIAAAADRKIARVVGVGTCAEQGRTEAVRRADTPAAPDSLYASCKHAAHLVGRSLCGPGTKLVWARVFHVLGPDQHPGWLIPSVLAAVRSGQAFELTGGEQVRQWMHVEDVGRALALIATAPHPPPVIQVCAAPPRTLRELLNALVEPLGGAPLLRWGARPYGPHEAMRIVGDPGPLLDLGFEPKWTGDGFLADLRARSAAP